VISNAGPNVIWVIAGRDNLATSRHTGHFVGYSAEFPRRLIVLDVQELSIDHVGEFIQSHASHHPISREQAAALHRATLGIPLALRQASDLWAHGMPIQAITDGIPDRAPKGEIMKVMSHRILTHCEDHADRIALFLLAMQRRPDALVQDAILNYSGKGLFDLDTRLGQLSARYSSVRTTGGGHLHESSAGFIREFLLTPEMRVSDAVQSIAKRAHEVTRERQRRLESDLPYMEDRCLSKDWQESVLDTLYWLFWYDEATGWREASAHLIEGLGYSPDFAQNITEIIRSLTTALGMDGLKRLETLRVGLMGNIESTEIAYIELSRWSNIVDPQN